MSESNRRRERWVWAESMDEGYNDIHKVRPTGEWADKQDYVHFVEIRPDEIVIKRELVEEMRTFTRLVQQGFPNDSDLNQLIGQLEDALK